MDVYPPQEDTRLMLSVIDELVKPGMKVLDIGTGSGVLGLRAKELGAQVTAVDINPSAVKEARKLGLNAVQSDLFSNVSGKYDAIIFNPPYLELSGEELRGEPIETALHGGRRGREVLDRFLETAGEHLTKNGFAIFLQAEFNGVDETEKKLNSLGFNYRILKTKYVPMEGNLVVLKIWRKSDGH